MKPFTPPVPVLTEDDCELIRNARRTLDALSERIAMAALDQSLMAALAVAVTAADDVANRLAIEHRVDGRWRSRTKPAFERTPNSPGDQQHRPARPSRRAPAKPRPDFPLTPHRNGQWVKKVNGRVVYFGLIGDPAGAEQRFAAFMAARQSTAPTATAYPATLWDRGGAA